MLAAYTKGNDKNQNILSFYQLYQNLSFETGPKMYEIFIKAP